MAKDLQIWVTYHKDEQVKEYNLKEDDTHKLFASNKSVEGENINHMNPVYSEMVTMYYVWKNNLRSKYIGFEHYRRHIEIGEMPTKGECQVFRIVDFLHESVYKQYGRCHNSKDMELMLQAIDNRYGKGNPYTKNIRESHFLIANCIFIMRWADFVKLCEFLFPLLEDFSALCGISTTDLRGWQKKALADYGKTDRTVYQTRILSFLAERLISAWIFTNLYPYLKDMSIAIVNYNTPTLVKGAICSLYKSSPGFHIYVFDNSDEKPFKEKMTGVSVLDNTKQQIINFDKELEKYPDKWDSDRELSNFGSMKHTMSVDKLIELLPKGFILMDSDVLVKDNVAKIWNENVACTGHERVKHGVPQLEPFLCYLNVPMIKEKGIGYYNGEKMWALSNKEPNQYYETGAWLLEEVRRNKLPVQFVDIWQFIMHLGHGSWRGNEEKHNEWLRENVSLWK